MYKKNVIYYIINIFIILVILLIPTNVYASGDASEGGGGANITSLGKLEDFKGSVASDSQKLKEMTGKIFGIIRAGGTVASVVILMMIGVKYMLGSVEEKAEYKKEFIPYIVGATLLFTGTLIPQLIYEIIQGF